MKDNQAVLAGLWLGVFAQLAAITSYSPLIPLMRKDLAFSFGDFGLMTTAFYIPYMTMQIVFGHIADRGHFRALMLPGMLGLIASTILLGSISNLPEALLLRALAGLAGATIFVPSVILINKLNLGRATLVLGIFGTSVAAGSLYVSLSGSMLGAWLGWRLAFLGLMVPGFAVWVALYIFVHDLPSPVLNAAEKKVAIPAGVLRRGVTWLLGCQQFIRVGMWTTISIFLPTFFTSLGYHVVIAGVALTIFSVFAALSSVLGGKLVERMNSNAKVTTISFGAMTVALMLAGAVETGVIPWLLAAALGLLVFMSFGPQYAIIPVLFSEEKRGFVTGLETALANSGAIAVPFLFGYLRDVTGAFEASWVLCSLLCIAAAIVGVPLARSEAKRLRR